MDNQVYQFNQESWNVMGMDPEQQIDDQAYMALRLSKKLNEQPEIVAADLDKAVQNSLPVNFYKTLDNAELPDNYTKEMLSKSISPILKRTIATSPERAAYFTKEQLEKWNAVAREAEAFRRHQNYIDSVLQRVETERSAKSAEDLEHERWMSVRDARKRRETWKQIQDQAQINKVVNALDAYWPDDFRRAGDRDLQARLEILNTMGIDTSMVDQDELRKTKGYQFREAVNLFGVLDAMENGENLGWLIANKMTDGAAVDLLSHVDENSPLFVQEKALELLRKERYASMPETGMEKAFNTLFKSTAFMTEMALTSGMGEAFGLVKAGGAPMLGKLVKDGFLKFIRENGLKGFGQAAKEGMKRAGANAVGRLPVYLPSVTLDTFSEVAPSVVTIPDDFGNPSITVKESDVTDFVQRLVTNTVAQSIEMFTEELGPLIPLGDLDAKMVAAFLPKTVRNFVAQSLIRNPATRRIAERAILDRVPFDGLIGEFGEEAIGQFMMFGATLLGYGMGFRPENTAGTMSPVMSKEEAGDTLASIVLQSVLFRGLQIAHAEFTNRGAIAMIRDAQRAKTDRTHFEAMRDLISETRLPQSNVNEAERTLGLLLNGDAVVSVTPESLEGILQQATEGKTEAEANEARATLEQLGITTDAIENAKKNGTDVLLSRNRLWAVSSNKGFKNAKELVDRILDNEVSEVFGKTTKEITADGFTKEQIDEMVDRSKRQEDFLLDVQKTMSEAIRTAQKNAIAAGNKLGISQQNVQDFVNIYKWMANYLAENVETEEGLAKLKEMVDNLSVQFAEAPEKFDTTAAVSGVAQARVASLERRVADIQSSIDALNSMDYLNDTQISQLEALKDDLEEAQNELEAAKNGALNQVSPVWTGSAASYDQPSLHYVGTGEGNQVYGWGLYGSSSRRVAEWYAKKDFQRKSKPGKLKFRGNEVVGPIGVAQAFEDVSDYRERVFHESALRRIQRYVEDSYGSSLPEIVNMVKEEPFPLYDGLTRERWDSIIDEVAKDLELVPGATASRNLYKQTFWADKEENLLDWEEFVSTNQAENVARGLFESLEQRDIPYSVFRLAGMPGHSPMNPLYDLTVSSDPVAEDGSQRFFLTRGKSDGHSVTISEDGTILRNAWNDELTGRPLSDLVGESAAKYIMEHRNGGTYQIFVYHPTQQDVVEALTPEIASMTGGELYEQLEDILGSPKAASEFLYRAGIDGVTYIGDSSGARNYVAFSDKDIRVDEHILFQRAPKVNAVANQLNALKDASPMTKEVVAADNGMADSEEVTDEETLSWLNSLSEDAKDEDKRLVRSTRWMQLIDGELYPVMNEKVAASKSAERVPPTRLGAWTKAAEHPEKAFWTDSNESTDAKRNRHYWQEGVSLEKQNPKGHTWWFELSKTTVDKDGKEGVSSVVAKYAPFNHSSEEDFINDQFTIGYKRPNVVLVEGVFPLYELNHPSGDSLGMSDKKTGRHPWNHKKTLAQLGPHNVTLTKYFKAERILSPKEAAEKMAGMFKDHPDVTVTWNVIPPPILKELLNTKIPGTDKYVQFMEATGLSKAEVQRLADTGYLDELRRRETPLWKNKDGTDVLYEDNTVLKGQINLARFKQSQEAIITLFKDADASTLPHESAHWLKAAMESLVGAGFATEKMKEDLATIDAWLDKQDYSEAKTDQDKYRAREEYFARAFEQYLREGRFPEAATTGLKSALRRLARMLQSIYRNALALNAPIDDSIRGFFDDIFAVEEVVDGTSVLSGILREINTGALAFSKEELKKLETAVAGAREDAETEAWLAALQDYQKGLKEQQKLWRNEAKEAYAASKAEQAYTYVRNGHKLDENFLRNVLKLDEETISILKKKRLTYRAAPVAETAAPAVEPAPTETPVSTASAEAPAATPLDGTPEQFDALDEDTTISLPEGEEAAQNAVANLVYGPDGKGGAIWKRIKVNPVEAELGDVLYKVYNAALKLFSKSGSVTKKGLLGYLSGTAFNAEQQAFRDRAKKKEKMVSMSDPVQGTEDLTVEDSLPDERSVREIFSGESEAYLTALSDFTDTLKEGSLKREIADIIYELADAGESATNEAIMAEYRRRGGTSGKTALYDAVNAVRTELRSYMESIGLRQSLDVETPASILDTMKELDYGDVNDLITDLKTALGRSAFIKDYMNRKHAEYREAFLDNPNWASEAGAIRYLDAILRALKVTEGMKFSERVKLARAEAMREVANNKTLREVLRTETAVRKSLKSNAAKILKSIKSGKEDKAAAITAALDMCRNDARLDAVKRLRAEADHLVRVAKRAGRGKPGSAVNGDAMNIVRAVLYHFGLSNRRPEWTTGPGDPQNVTEAFRILAEFAGRTKKGITDPAAMGSYVQMERDKWSSWLWGELTGANARARAAETAERRINDAGFTRELFGDDYYNTLLAETTAEELARANEARTAFLDLSMVQLRELSDFAAWANGTGRESVLADKKSFAAKLNANLEAILPSLKEHAKGAFKDNADKKTLEKLASSARAGIHSNKSILWISHLYDGRTEFFGEHIMGPMRRLFQLPLSAGASREMFWYDRISAAVKPHEVALMKSAQDRKLTFAVNNEVTKRRGYEQVYGKQCAFILLNAGTVEGRQRLMDGFGWTEAELNANLSKFTKEDFEHAEAIWASLKELGTEVAKTFYKERHYRMPWADLAPIEVPLEDGTRILSDGGYFPIAYKYHDSERGYDTDIMNPFERMPNRQGRPSATFGRESEVHRQVLLLDPSVLERHIKETSHYVGMWEPLSMANAIWSNPDFKDSAIQYFGPEAYRVLRDCMNYINNPFQNTGKGRQLANWLGASFATVALGYKITTIEKQYVSLLLGVDRLVNHIKKEGGGDEIQGYFKDAWDLSFTGFPDAPGIRGFRSKVADMSPFLRSRFNNYDRDITVVNSEFKSKAGQATDKFRYVGFLGLKLCDLHVAGVQWYAAYQWALNSKQNFSDTEARAFADDFVASTQGGARTIDMPAIQLSDLGKAVTPFFGPACAAFNTRLAGLAAFKEMTPSERVSFAVDNFLLPVVALGLISAIQGGLIAAAIGGGDDDDWDRVRRRSLIAMLSEPVSGIAVIQDVADAVVRAAVNGRPIQDEVLEVGAFRPFNDIVKNAYGAVRAWDNPDYALYLGVSAAGEAMGVPVVQVYEDYEKMILWNFGDKSSKPIKKQLQGEKRK